MGFATNLHSVRKQRPNNSQQTEKCINRDKVNSLHNSAYCIYDVDKWRTCVLLFQPYIVPAPVIQCSTEICSQYKIHSIFAIWRSFLWNALHLLSIHNYIIQRMGSQQVNYVALKTCILKTIFKLLQEQSLYKNRTAKRQWTSGN
jgi:hypothetical protein